jgi:mediator of DNA damage checkpoint protein 1
VSLLYLSLQYEGIDGQYVSERYYSPDPIMIFSGVVACATDVSELSLITLYDIDVDYKLSQWDLEVLSAGITSLGGQWRTALTRDVTHLFALHKQSNKVLTLLFH